MHFFTAPAHPRCPPALARRPSTSHTRHAADAGAAPWLASPAPRQHARPRSLQLALAASLLGLALLGGCASVDLNATNSANVNQTTPARTLPTPAPQTEAVTPATAPVTTMAPSPASVPPVATTATSGKKAAAEANSQVAKLLDNNLADDAETARLLLEADLMGDTHEPPPPRTYPDIWSRIRAGFGMQGLQGDARVTNYERMYANKEGYWARVTERAGRYLFHIVEEVERRNMPTELALLPVIESAFNPQALSVAKASGMWQFIPSTGKLYDLRQNLFSDERRDVIASTNAALNYLQRLHEMFDDWHLALAAYNWGEGSVQRAINKNRAKGLPTDYSSLRMPAETRGYVPKLLAVKHLVANPEQFGIILPPIPDNPYFSTVVIHRDMDTDLIAKLAGISMERFQDLNPSFKRPIVLGELNQEILLPYDDAIRFQNNLSNYRGPLCSWKVIKLANNAAVEELARQWSMDESSFRRVNGLPSGRMIQSGSVVLVTKQANDYSNTKAELADSATLVLVAERPSVARITYVVRKGDTLASVSRRFNTPMGRILKVNQLRNRKLVPGQKLVIERTLRSQSKRSHRAVPAARTVASKGAPAKAAAKPTTKTTTKATTKATPKPTTKSTKKAAPAKQKAHSNRKTKIAAN